MNSLIAILVVIVVFGVLGVLADLLAISVDQMLSLSDKDPQEHRQATSRWSLLRFLATDRRPIETSGGPHQGGKYHEQ